MFIETIKNNGKPYLRLVHAVRKPNKNGDMVSKKEVILNIGPLDRFDDGQPDYVARLKESFKAGDPLIPSLKPYCSDKAPAETWQFSNAERSPACIGHPKLASHILLDRILEELGLNTLFASYKAQEKPEFDVYGFARLLICGRILNPASESALVRQNDDYYGPILRKGFHPDNVFDTLDFICNNQDRIIRRMNTNLVKKAHRSPETVYYDAVNFCFEADEPEDDIPDEAGNVT